MTATARPKVLLVDDRRDNLVALEAILQGLPVDVVSVMSGEDALKRLLVEDFAVVLLDAQMPGMDGFETAEQVRRRRTTAQVPIIFLTAYYYDTHFAFLGYAAGAVDYIIKPLDPWVLRAKVSVFAELWARNQQLREQMELARRRADEHSQLRATVRQAELLLLDMLADGDDPERLRAAVRAAVHLLHGDAD